MKKQNSKLNSCIPAKLLIYRSMSTNLRVIRNKNMPVICNGNMHFKLIVVYLP